MIEVRCLASLGQSSAESVGFVENLKWSLRGEKHKAASTQGLRRQTKSQGLMLSRQILAYPDPVPLQLGPHRWTSARGNAVQ